MPSIFIVLYYENTLISIMTEGEDIALEGVLEGRNSDNEEDGEDGEDREDGEDERSSNWICKYLVPRLV